MDRKERKGEERIGKKEGKLLPPQERTAVAAYGRQATTYNTVTGATAYRPVLTFATDYGLRSTAKIVKNATYHG
jgi:hypothetical protein